MSAPSLPISQHERSAVVDVLRGFALGGVIVANLASFVAFVMPTAVTEKLTSTTADHIYEYIMTVFIDTKFITLFSLLFGYGFGVIMERVSEKGINTTWFFSRRMFILLVVGLIHISAWWGEVLHMYGFIGLLLLLFRNMSDKGLLYAAVFLQLIPPTMGRYFQIESGAYAPAIKDPIMEQYLHLSLSHNPIAIVKANWITYRYIFLTCLGDIRDTGEILAKFLFGYYVMRKGYLKDLPANMPTIKRFFFFFCLPLALIYVAELSAFSLMQIKIENIFFRLPLFAFNRFGILALSLCYACLIIFMYARWQGAKVFAAFRYIGMMSLTNYLTHTLIFIFIFNGIGLGMMGKLNLIYTLPIGAGILVIQAFISRWWMRKYQYRPAEWIWRQLSYGKKLNLRREG